VLGDITPEKIAFELDGDAVKVDRKKVAGFIYFRRENTDAPKPRCVVQGHSGMSANVATMRLAGANLHIKTTVSAEFDWPLDDISVADYSAGKLAYLSDLEPASMKATPLIAQPVAATSAVKNLEPHRDQSANGGPLTLIVPTSAGEPTNSEVKSFAKGLAIRSRTELIYRLPAGYRRLNAVAGIDPLNRSYGNVRLEIYGDDQPLMSADVAGNEPPTNVDVEIAGVKRLKIVVDYGANQGWGDWLNLCDLKVVK
jgi:hypothetical protein